MTDNIDSIIKRYPINKVINKIYNNVVDINTEIDFILWLIDIDSKDIELAKLTLQIFADIESFHIYYYRFVRTFSNNNSVTFLNLTFLNNLILCDDIISKKDLINIHTHDLFSHATLLIELSSIDDHKYYDPDWDNDKNFMDLLKKLNPSIEVMSIVPIQSITNDTYCIFHCIRLLLIMLSKGLYIIKDFERINTVINGTDYFIKEIDTKSIPTRLYQLSLKLRSLSSVSRLSNRNEE
jgi:hypothetical protein